MTDIDTSLMEVNSLMSVAELEEREVVIERGKQTFIEVGNALREIRDRKGYRHKYGTFEDYCEQRWGFSANYARRQINATEAVQRIRENSALGHENLTEKQVRPIASLKPEQQIAFAETHDIAAMTSREVEKAVKEYKQKLADAEQRVSNLAEQLTDTTEENQMLKQENRELYEQSRQQEPVVVTKEVIPEDYEELKREVTKLTLDLQAAQYETNRKIEGVGKTRKEVTEEVVLVAMRINNFIKDVANAVFLRQAIEEFSEYETRELDASLKLLEDWLYAMKGNNQIIEGEIINAN